MPVENVLDKAGLLELVVSAFHCCVFALSLVISVFA